MGDLEEIIQQSSFFKATEAETLLLSLFVLFSSWVVQRGTILTNPGPLEESAFAHIMTQQNTRLSLASIRGIPNTGHYEKGHT